MEKESEVETVPLAAGPLIVVRSMGKSWQLPAGGAISRQLASE